MEILAEKGLDYNSFFFLYKHVNNIDIDDIQDYGVGLIQNNFIDFSDPIKITVTEQGYDFVKYVVSELKKEINKEKKLGNINTRKEIKDWIDEYRALFKGTKIGIMGDPKSCLDKMVRFFEEYPELADKDLIFKATKKYIDSEAMQNYKYLQRADYFIYKLVGKDETSRLASFCSDVEENQLQSNILDLN